MVSGSDVAALPGQAAGRLVCRQDAVPGSAAGRGHPGGDQAAPLGARDPHPDGRALGRYALLAPADRRLGWLSIGHLQAYEIAFEESPSRDRRADGLGAALSN